MEWFVRAFVRSSLARFTGGIILGLAMAVRPDWVIYRPAHAHMNVVRFSHHDGVRGAISCCPGCSGTRCTAAPWP